MARWWAAQLSRWRVAASAAAALGLLGGGALVVAACKGKAPEPAAAVIVPGDGGADVPELMAVGPSADAGPPALPSADAPRVYALVSPAPVFSAPEFPPKDPTKASEDRIGVIRLGYLRKGAPVVTKPGVLKKSSCAEGWYELAEGGFVCGKFVTTDPNHKDLANAPHAPFADGPLPYEYGLNLTNGTPLYRRPPLRSERKQYEAGLHVGKTPKDDKGLALPVSAEGAPEGAWYAKRYNGARPQLSLDDLKGESGLVPMRMVRGFYLALDKKVSAFSGPFWRTTGGFLAPRDHILVHKPTTEFEGVWVGHDDEPRKLPLGFILGLHARKWRIDDQQKTHRMDKLPRFTIVGLTGKKTIVDGRAFFETTEGWYLRDLEGTVVKASPRPSDVPAGEKWIEVDLKAQTLVAYEDDKPVYATIVSTGRHDDDDPKKDHRTVAGSFRLREKHVSDTMDDDGASDGPYSIEDVPWVMYFQGSYALHGAFWHSSFGHERSHGCVNMTPHDARNLFGWVGPRLPEGWHGVRATASNPGTRVIVRGYDPTPPR